MASSRAVKHFAPTLALAAALFLVPVLAGDFCAYQLSLYLLYGMVAQGVALTWGRLGFLSLGQALFFGLAAYLSGTVLKASQGHLGHSDPGTVAAGACLTGLRDRALG